MNLYKLVCTFLFALLITWSNVGNAQEQLRPLSRNNNLPEIKQPNLLSHKTTSITPLNLPFFDDLIWLLYNVIFTLYFLKEDVFQHPLV